MSVTDSSIVRFVAADIVVTAVLFAVFWDEIHANAKAIEAKCGESFQCVLTEGTTDMVGVVQSYSGIIGFVILILGFGGVFIWANSR